MNRRNFIKLLGISTSGLLLPSFSCNRARQNKPNILFILADDLGWSQLGCYGSNYYETPQIDQLAVEGKRFTDAYAACPVCSPTRASILTGKYPARLHLTDFIAGGLFPYAKLKQPEWQKFLKLEEITIAEILKEAGYKTASFGKWHLSIEKKPPQSLPYNPDKQGFDKHIVTYKPTRDQDPENDAHNVELITQKSLEFLEQNKDQPFFLYVAHNSIHDPLKEKADLIERYKNKPGSDLPENNPVIAAMLERLDSSIGRLLNKLDELNISDNTVVIFFSDNGGLKRDAWQTPLRGGKAQLYEGGIRVPFMIRWPGKVSPNSVCTTPVSSVDFLPTFCDIIKLQKNIPENVDGTSILPLITHNGSINRDAIFWHYPHYHSAGIVPSGAIRKGRFKLIEWYDTSLPETEQPFELYDLEQDLGETKNLVEEKPKVFLELKNQLEEWRQLVGAQMLEINPAYDENKAQDSN
jgi:arylsulfatase A